MSFICDLIIKCSEGLHVFLFQLLDTKSTDRKITLLHYIANVVKDKYQQVSLFYNELNYVEKAAAGMKHVIRQFDYICNKQGRPYLLKHQSLTEQISTKWVISVYSLVSLENVLLDVKELQRGMDLTRRESSMHGHNTLLKDFIQQNENKLKKIQDDAKIAQVPRT